MLKPLEQWYCDKCKDIIETASEGYVLWRSNDDQKALDFIIIHKVKCDDRGYSFSAALKDFLGVNGLIYLTSFLSIGPLKKSIGQGSRFGITQPDEFVDFMRRLQTPYYEEARTKFSSRDVLEWYSDSNEVAPYSPDSLKKIINM